MKKSAFVKYNAWRAADRVARIMDIIRERSKPNEAGCWIWQRYINKGGYGLLAWEGKQDRAHRVAYKVSVGPVPPGMDVCHTCDNPACCNPEHLWLGTRTQNALDSVVKGRNPRATKTHCVRGHSYAEHGYYWKARHRKCRLCEAGRYQRPQGRKSNTHCINGHELTIENIYVAPGTTYKRCRQCRHNAVYAHFDRVAGRLSDNSGT